VPVERLHVSFERRIILDRSASHLLVLSVHLGGLYQLGLDLVDRILESARARDLAPRAGPPCASQADASRPIQSTTTPASSRHSRPIQLTRPTSR
jgi:hypothetical protein